MSKKKPIIKVRTPDKTREKRFAYDPGKKNTGAELLCKYCKAVYEDKHWKRFDKLNPKYIDKLHKTVCPTCHEKRSLVSDGVLRITGTILKNHSKEIMGLILNLEAKESRRDVLNRIERIEARAGNLTVYTAKNQLAAELGKKVSNAYKGGELTIKWSKGDKPADVRWHKDETNYLT
jgi:hypothetical protein